MKNLKNFLNSPLPRGQELDHVLAEVWQYAQENPVKSISELAEQDVIDGLAPTSANPIYVACYRAAMAFHSIEAEAK